MGLGTTASHYSVMTHALLRSLLMQNMLKLHTFMHSIISIWHLVSMQRYLFMKLTYHEDTPEDYEPPHFKPITEDGLGHFARKPFSM